MTELKLNKPYTPSMRGTILLRSTSRKNEPFKRLTVTKKSSGGRNHSGHITMRFRGAGNKKKYRIIAFKKTIFDVNAKVLTIEYDPNRNAEIALLNYDNGQKEYVIAVDKLKVGDIVINSKKDIVFFFITINSTSAIASISTNALWCSVVVGLRIYRPVEPTIPFNLKSCTVPFDRICFITK